MRSRLPWSLEAFCVSEIDNLNRSMERDEDIVWFYVTVSDTLGVHVGYAEEELFEETV